MNGVEVRNLSVSFRRKGRLTQALQGVTFSAPAGSMVGIIGASGCGKSTLLRVLAGVERDYDGEVRIYGRAPNARKGSYALVPQHFGLLPWKKVSENILFPLRLGKTKAEDTTLEELVSLLGIGSLLERYPAELSGGQQQRVALARAFLQQSELLLLDEPFSALDANNALQCREFLMERMKKRERTTTFWVSHNVDEVTAACDFVFHMEGFPGTIAGKRDDNWDETAEADRN